MSHMYIYYYKWLKTADRETWIGNASVARDAAQTELGEHRRPFERACFFWAIGWAPCTMNVSASSMCDSTST